MASVLLLGLAISIHPGNAQTPDPITLGYGTATLNGQFGPGEWDNATIINMNANVPLEDGGGTIPVKIYLMNDDYHIYLGLKVGRSPISGTTNLVFEIDYNNNGMRDVWDEHFGMSVGKYSGVVARDGFFTSEPPCRPEGVCGFSDTDYGGTNNVQAAAFYDEEFTYIELSYPLDSNDDLHDMSLIPGDVIGFSMGLRLFSQNTSCNFGGNCTADTSFPTYGYYPVEISQGNPPVANPGGPYLGASNSSIMFNGTQSSDPDGDPLTYIWTFGDGSKGYRAMRSHIY